MYPLYPSKITNTKQNALQAKISHRHMDISGCACIYLLVPSSTQKNTVENADHIVHITLLIQLFLGGMPATAEIPWHENLSIRPDSQVMCIRLMTLRQQIAGSTIAYHALSLPLLPGRTLHVSSLNHVHSMELCICVHGRAI
jgi:hypothetical protein|mmetsp:Transcript_22406/g.38130  ORF Transcript_22406/g.38130 Transcript_22406/m.38130 type:complete len:142 (-) Transcript_22406:2884-3309(-)